MTSSELSNTNSNISEKQLSPVNMQQIAGMLKSEILKVMHKEILPALRHEVEGIIEETIRQYDSPNRREGQCKKVSEMVRQGVETKEEGRIGTLQIGILFGNQQNQTESTYRGSMAREYKYGSGIPEQRSETGE
ncbi:hypothetical protein HBH53_035520 [Parastagonospora nodorum]|nr:hypothetical protein HBH53_035520 [Parastagonospora nodorum]KAH3984721.1 hypothetical protein HBH51_025650 [Parastagonospora nodorum]KAH5205365.1 hypothetical protein HBH77_097200 [Parastagonospora nodorum]KAH5720726.1 hypothetical protein HBI18_154090 [Parastagonospora nodorum]KAH5792629.1 hypothetical protein HBI97_036910 [Parastagonospora nodorum]